MFRQKLVHARCFETILITNCYIFGSNEGIICVLCTLKINHKHFVSVEIALPIVNKAVINALHLQLFSKMRKVNTTQIAAILTTFESLMSNLPGNWVQID